MAGSLSDFAELELLDHVFKVGEYSQPANIYVALSTADPGESGAGIAEPVGNGYARVAHNTWDVATSRATKNTGVITFAEASGSWGVITHFAIFDHVDAGNMLAYGELSASKTIGAGDDASFAAGAIDISFNAGGISDYLANELLDHLFKTGAYTVPTHIYVGLSTADPTDDGSGIIEPGENYARKEFDTWNVAAAGATSNDGAITFVTADASWGTITYFFLSDGAAANGDNMLFRAAVDAAKAVGNGDTAKFDDETLFITLT